MNRNENSRARDKKDSELTLNVRMAIPLNFPLSGKVMQSSAVILPHPSKKLLMSSSDE
jgi:hypothetical protein